MKVKPMRRNKNLTDLVDKALVLHQPTVGSKLLAANVAWVRRNEFMLLIDVLFHRVHVSAREVAQRTLRPVAHECKVLLCKR